MHDRQRNPNVIDLRKFSEKSAKRRKQRHRETVSLIERINGVDLKAPWVLRLIAVVAILLLSMLIL